MWGVSGLHLGHPVPPRRRDFRIRGTHRGQTRGVHASPPPSVRITEPGGIRRGSSRTRIPNRIQLFGVTGFLLAGGAVDAMAEFVRICHALTPPVRSHQPSPRVPVHQPSASDRPSAPRHSGDRRRDRMALGVLHRPDTGGPRVPDRSGGRHDAVCRGFTCRRASRGALRRGMSARRGLRPADSGQRAAVHGTGMLCCRRQFSHPIWFASRRVVTQSPPKCLSVRYGLRESYLAGLLSGPEPAVVSRYSGLRADRGQGLPGPLDGHRSGHASRRIPDPQGRRLAVSLSGDVVSTSSQESTDTDSS
ncbi:hypothetical protein SUDANB176_07559 (plasmid) [Streptomyces sp. enrichment culture]